MDITFLRFLAFTVSLAYLLLCIVQLRPDFILFEQFRGLNRLRTPGISLFPKPSSRKKALTFTLSLFAGILTIWVWAAFESPIQLLLFLLIAGLCIEELDEPKKLRELPAVLGLVKQVLKYVQTGDDLLEALGKAARTLPDGPVKHRVKKTLSGMEERLPPEKSLPILRGINPYLDQFVNDCLRAGWQNGSVLEIMLELLLLRASTHWQSSSPVRVWLERLRPSLPSMQAFITGNFIMGSVLLLQEYPLPTGLVLSAITAAMVLRFALVSPILRRTILVSAVVLMFLPPAFIVQPIHPNLAKALPREALPQRREILWPPGSHAEAAKIRGLLDELAQCYVQTGFDDGFANLRSGPGMQHRILAVIPEAERLLYLGQTGNFAEGEWRQVRAGAQIGWMYAPLCRTFAEAAQGRDDSSLAAPLPPASITSTPLNISVSSAECQIETGFSEGWANLRVGPGMDFQVITTLPEATQLQVIGEKGDFYTSGIWYRVQAVDDTQGWIFKELCRHDDDEH